MAKRCIADAAALPNHEFDDHLCSGALCFENNLTIYLLTEVRFDLWMMDVVFVYVYVIRAGYIDDDIFL